MSHEGNKDEKASQENERFLDLLKEGNDKRRQELHKLVEEYEKEVDNDDRRLSDPTAALQIELDLLKEQQQQTTQVGATASLLASSPEDRPSDTTVQQALMDEYATEVLDSYQDLVETQSTLEMVLEREKRKLQVKRSFVEQQKSLLEPLQEEQRLFHLKGKKDDEGDEPSPSAEDSIEKENEWIRKELGYVLCQLSPAKEKEAGGSKDSRQRKKKRRRPQVDDSKESSPLPLKKLILGLTQRLLDDPKDPYLKLEDYAEEDERDEMVKELLLNSGVAQTHPENDGLIRLTDYRH